MISKTDKYTHGDDNAISPDLWEATRESTSNLPLRVLSRPILRDCV